MSHAESSPVVLPRVTRVFWVLVGASALAIAFGIYCFARQTELGFITTGLRNPGYGGAAWGLYIAFDVYYTGVSFAGITVAAIARLFDVESLKPVTRTAELLTISSLLTGACTVVSDLGRPIDGLTKLPRVADPQSPFYGTFTLVVAGYLFSSFVFFFLSGRGDAARLAGDPARRRLRWLYRLWASGYTGTSAEQARHRRVSFWLSIGILPLLVTAHSTLGLIFGIQSGRPGWYSALQPPAFVVLAAVSGTGILMLVVMGARRLFSADVPAASIRWLGNFLWVLSLTYLYFMVVDALTTSYAGPEADREVAHQVVGGAFAPIFWAVVGSLTVTVVIGFVQYVRKSEAAAPYAVAAVFANVAAVLKRVLIVVPSQTHGAFLRIEEHGYRPAWIEIGIVCGLAAFVVLVFLLFARIFPLVPLHAQSPPSDSERVDRRDRSRMVATFATMAVALGLIAIGLFDSFRQLRPGEIDPRIPYSPVLFAAGVMILFTAAAVYELYPRRSR